MITKTYELAQSVRRNNISVEIDYLGRSVKAQMREANKLNSEFVLFFGGEEYSEGKVQLKNMKNGTQELVKIENLVNKISGD
ncbi:MAG: hypothetical protein IIB07_10510 [Bacteroidetes bacterium]|nr:hypothetical protein [Bacteroidota bacterium]